jgi:hypothetical protein
MGVVEVTGGLEGQDVDMLNLFPPWQPTDCFKVHFSCNSPPRRLDAGGSHQLANDQQRREQSCHAVVYGIQETG